MPPTALAPTKRRPLYETLADDLRADIHGRRQDDLRLPTEEELCDAHGVSRITVRKALDILTAEGMIERAPGRGTFVRQPSAPKRRDARGMVAGINVADMPSTINFVSLQVLGASEFLARHGAHISVKKNPHTPADAAALIQECVESGVRGFLCYSHNDETPRSLGQEALRRRLPAVLMNTRADDLPLDYVTGDNVAGGAMAARYLASLGHRRVAFFSEVSDVSVRDRLQGFQRETAALGGVAAPFVPRQGTDHESWAAFLRDARGFTAVQCGNDHMAATLILRLAQAGLRVPGDISVMGYDNSVAHCETGPVPITTLEQPAREMGRRAAQFLWERMTGIEPPASRRTLLSPSLVVRASAAPPRPAPPG